MMSLTFWERILILRQETPIEEITKLKQEITLSKIMKEYILKRLQKYQNKSMCKYLGITSLTLLQILKEWIQHN